MENKGAIGKITQVISAVLDIKFSEGHLPEINDAIRIPLKETCRKSIRSGERIATVACVIVRLPPAIVHLDPLRYAPRNDILKIDADCQGCCRSLAMTF